MDNLRKVYDKIIEADSDATDKLLEFSESLSDDDDFDMGAEDFKATDEIMIQA